MTTFEILESLQTEVGSRRAGTDGERRAQEWLKSRTEKLDLFVEMDEFTFIGNEKYRPVMMMIMFVFIAVSIGLFMFDQFLAAMGMFIAYFLIMNLRKKIELRFATTRSQNVIAGLKRPISEFVEGDRKSVV